MTRSLVLPRGIVAICLIGLLASSVAAEERKGLAGLFRASSKAQDEIVSGPVAKACGVRGKALGKVVEKGPGRWKLHDTNPGSTGQRDFYVTGFSDGCPRRVTGAVAMFGAVELYELVHYGPVGVKPKGLETDRAYAEMRARICGNSNGPCKPSGVRKLSRQAVFVDVYASAAGSGGLQLLMSGGKLAAVSKR